MKKVEKKEPVEAAEAREAETRHRAHTDRDAQLAKERAAAGKAKK